MEYRDYTEDGDIIAEGTEDFSKDRFRSLSCYGIHTWDGRMNKGGCRRFDFEGLCWILKGHLMETKKLYQKLYHGKLVQLRKL